LVLGLVRIVLTVDMSLQAFACFLNYLLAQLE